MVVESFAIILVILLITYGNYRANRQEYGRATLPLVILPAVHILGMICGEMVASPFPSIGADYVIVLLDGIGVLVSGVLYGAFSRGLRSKISRRLYLIVASGFTVLLFFLLTFGIFRETVAG